MTEDAADLWDGYRFLRDYGIFPVAGGLLQQSAKFLATIRLCDRVHSVYAAYMRLKLEAQERAQRELEGLMGNS